eukprot:CAMPEP_0170268580 /NCGR_PEP_ID=MMETSP0116_2-20130129/34223_1 /TAXON_ID=400756 /ORGANISM="Durinskia baltica, Strain CSIRO CS-38" /LENGTH=205 /DNA_ID=CAMNT_0010519749 /DNA_START=467 /DNA_END=1084 /DNA_ORIENTATION=-
MSGCPTSNKLMIATVFFPTPGNLSNNSCTRSLDSFRKYSKDVAPRSTCTFLRMCWIHFVFFGAKPPQRMAVCTVLGVALRTWSQVLNLVFKFANAAAEFVFVVFCDSIVPTTVSRISRRDRPWVGRRSPNTAANCRWRATTSAGVGRAKPGKGLPDAAELPRDDAPAPARFPTSGLRMVLGSVAPFLLRPWRTLMPWENDSPRRS